MNFTFYHKPLQWIYNLLWHFIHILLQFIIFDLGDILYQTWLIKCHIPYYLKMTSYLTTTHLHFHSMICPTSWLIARWKAKVLHLNSFVALTSPRKHIFFLLNLSVFDKFLHTAVWRMFTLSLQLNWVDLNRFLIKALPKPLDPLAYIVAMYSDCISAKWNWNAEKERCAGRANQVNKYCFKSRIR